MSIWYEISQHRVPEEQSQCVFMWELKYYWCSLTRVTPLLSRPITIIFDSLRIQWCSFSFPICQSTRGGHYNLEGFAKSGLVLNGSDNVLVSVKRNSLQSHLLNIACVLFSVSILEIDPQPISANFISTKCKMCSQHLSIHWELKADRGSTWEQGSSCS